jgi:ABC-2 type transport system ATP-binding protein
MLRLRNVSKAYGGVSALNEMNLDIPEGQIFGLLGPNGAGKTTLIRCLMGLQNISQGQIRLFDRYPPGAAAVRPLLGYMPQQLAIYDHLTVRENLRFFGQVYGLSPPLINQRSDALLAMTELESKADTLALQLSGGMIRSLVLATALIHKPRFLILDEPTAGVDPVLRLKFWRWFRELCDDGTSILVTTHHINEAAQSDQIVFLRQGQVIGQGTPSELQTQFGGDSLEETFISVAEQIAPQGLGGEL